MKITARWFLLGLALAVALWMALASRATSALALAAPTPQLAGDRRAYHPETGRLTFIGFDHGHGPVMGGAMARRSMASQGEAMLAPYAAAFGVGDAQRDLKLESAGDHSVRFQQVVNGIPVVAGEMVVSLSDDGSLESINGEISPDPDVADAPQVSAAQAASAARQAVAKWYGLDLGDVSASAPEQWILDERLLRPSDRPAILAWRVIVTAGEDQPIEEYVFVDAVRGSIPVHWNQIDTEWGGLPSAGGGVVALQADTATPT
ncbi:MAG TPA: hypothetical protein VK449_05605, partial [Anaerolineales bacterium]|nr:hypothetical protein [Anaerolineales bacterium]